MSRYYTSNIFVARIFNDWWEIFDTLSPEDVKEILHGITKYPEYEPKNIPLWGYFKARLQEQYEVFLGNKEMRARAGKRSAEARRNANADYQENLDGQDVPKTEIVEPEIYNQKFITKTDDLEIIAALRDPASGLSIFLETGSGYDDALSRSEREFVDRGDVRALCAWHRELVKKTKEVKRFVPPSLEEWLEYCRSLNLDTRTMENAYNSYAVADWRDSRGSPIKNWKQKILQVWNKPEHANKANANFNKKPNALEEMFAGQKLAEEILRKRGVIQ